VNLDGQNFDAKMTDQKGVFNAAIDMQKLLSSPSKQLTASIVDGNQKYYRLLTIMKSLQILYQNLN
jgi:PAT family beta-lactamase induction signal transducer AmpG